MAKAKYKKYFELMVEQNKVDFDNFSLLYKEYEKNEEALQERFNFEGKKIQAIIRDWEGKLCRQSEKGGFSQYTGKLAEKFWGEVRIHFPLIDNVGIIVKKAPAFNIKKIGPNRQS